MRPRTGHWLVCSFVTALAACLNPLPDDNPSRAGHPGSVPGMTPPGNSPSFGSNGEMHGSPSDPQFPDIGSGDGPDQESPADNGSSGPADAGAPDGGSLRTTARGIELAPDAGASNEPP